MEIQPDTHFSKNHLLGSHCAKFVTFLAPAIKRAKKGPDQKDLLKEKISCFITVMVNHAMKLLKFINNEPLF